MALWQVAALVLFSACLAGGQLLLRNAARTFPSGKLDLFELALSPFAGWFALAIATYAALTVAWIGILRVTSLTSAYPFVALSIVFTLLAGSLFGEPLSLRSAAGAVVVVIGLVIISG